MSEKPAGENGFLTEHAGLLIASFRYWTGNELVPDNGTALTKARALWEAPFAVVSHNTDQDPIFNYGNATALRLFEMDWSSLTQLPSRMSAEPVERAERSRLMAEVTRKGFVDDYSGIRISASGQRFHIERATVWNLIDSAGHHRGQAAFFNRWRFL